MYRTTAWKRPGKTLHEKAVLAQSYLGSRGQLIVLGALFLLGVVVGRYYVYQLDGFMNADAQAMLRDYILHRSTQAIIQTVWTSFLSNALLMAVLFFCGFCTISAPIVYFVPFFRGLGYGFALGSLFYAYGLSAIHYVLVLQVPQMMISSIILLLSSSLALQQSKKLIGGLRGEKSPLQQQTFCVKFLIFISLLFLCAVLDGLLFYLFGGVFALM